MTSGTLVLGLLNGLIISLLAVGFVLIYKANRFLNLAGAQLGVLSAVLLLKVVNDWGWNWWGSFIGCVVVGVATGLLVERFFVGPVRRKTKAPVRLLILTIGVSQVLLALTYIPGLTPASQAPFPQPFTSHLQVGGVVLSGMSVLTMIVVPALLVLLWVFLEFSSTGKQIRAAAGNPDAARLCGISVNRVSLITWGIAGGLSAFAAVLNGPTTTSFNAAAAGPYLLMLTMGAAAFGAFVSFPVAVAGGIGLGLVYQVVVAETNNAGTAELAVFGVILLAIFVRGRAIGRAFATEGAAVPERPGLRVPEVLKSSMLLRHGMKWLVGISLVVAVVFPLLPYFKSNQFLLVLVLVYALVGVSLTMLIGWSGQVSLGHFALVGIAAYLTARWAGRSGWSVVEMLVVTGVVGAAVMVAIGLPALRVRGLTLAVTTLGLAVIAPDWLYLQSWVGGATPFTTPVQVTSVLPGLGQIGSQLYLYYVVLVVLVAVVAAAATLRRSAIGRIVIAVRDNERASAAFGIKPATVKLRVLALSGFVAASAGVFWALDWQSVSPTQFTADISIAVLAIPVIGGLGSLGGAVAAAVLLYMGTFFIGPTSQRSTGFLRSERWLLVVLQRYWCGRLDECVSQRHSRSGPRLLAGLPQPQSGPVHGSRRRGKSDGGEPWGPRVTVCSQLRHHCAARGEWWQRSKGSYVTGDGCTAAGGRRRNSALRWHRSTRRVPHYRRLGRDSGPHRSKRRGQDHLDERDQRGDASRSWIGANLRPRGGRSTARGAGALRTGAELPRCVSLRRVDGDRDRPGGNFAACQDLSLTGAGRRALGSGGGAQ